METPAADPLVRDEVLSILETMPAFQRLDRETLLQLFNAAKLVAFAPGVTLLSQEAAAESFAVILDGTVSIYSERGHDEPVHLGDIAAPTMLGEIGILLKEPRTATVAARTPVRALLFTAPVFGQMLKHIPGFAIALLQHLAARLGQVSRDLPLPEPASSEGPLDPRLLDLLPRALLERHRMLPVHVEHNTLTLGFVDDPSSAALGAVRMLLPALEVRMVRITPEHFDRALASRAGLKEWLSQDEPAAEPQHPGRAQKLDALLGRMVAEGASDLHLAAGHQPRWRVDGTLREIRDLRRLDASAVAELLDPILDSRHREEFERELDVDFPYSIPRIGRFRIHMFRSQQGSSAVVRLVPSRVLGLQELGLPPGIARFCEAAHGLVLVAGPTGSGKSTTLAALVDHINKTQPVHVISIEDPIEYVHHSDKALVQQREIGSDTHSYARALRAALREDPEVVLVGELRDAETMALAIETASTGHLVLAGLHSGSATAAIERLVDSFSTEQQQRVRALLADVLRGVVAQTLVKQPSVGRAAAVEVLVVNRAVANLIREGKTHQIPSIMQSGKQDGQILLNDSLLQLVQKNKVGSAAALAVSSDRDDLARRLGALPGGQR